MSVSEAGAAVVIVSYRRPDLALRCAASVAAEGLDVVVVDNASGDGSVEELRAAGLRVVERQSNDGFAAAVNAGFRATEALFVLVLNADTALAPDAVQILVDHLRAHPEAAVVGPRLLAADGTALATAYRRFPGPLTLLGELTVPWGYLTEQWQRLDRYRVPPSAWEHGGAVAHVQGAAMAVRRVAWEASGGLDEGYFLYLEETDWQRRLASLGWQVHVAPSAVGEHLGRSGDPSSAPSPEFLRSMERYLSHQRVPVGLTRVLVTLGLTASRLGLRVLGLVPVRGARSRARVADWDALWRAWRHEIRQRPCATAGRRT